MVSSRGLPTTRRTTPPHFSRGQVASVLHHVGVLLELQGANTFRIRSYLNGSRTIGSLQESLHDLVATGRLLEIKGIGKGLGGAISDAVMEGRWPDEWYELERSVPSGLIDLLDVPNLGPKRIRILNQELGVTSVEELESACASGEVEGLKGFGAKSQQRYLDGIELLRRFRSRRRLDIGLRYGEALERRIRSMDGVLRATLAGSARRRKETIGDLDVVVAAHPEDHGPISEALQSIEGVVDVKGAGASKVSLILDASIFSEDGYALSHLDPKVLEAIGGTEYESMEASGTIDAQVRIVPPSMEAYTLAYFTGSKEHNIRMRQRAIERGLRLNEFGLAAEADLGELKGAATAEYSLPALEERDIYHHLDLEYVPPELREDLGEIEAAANGQMPMLLDATSIRGALHNHTILSDGEASLEVMADAARRMGWSWMGIADHSPTLTVANGASAEDLLDQGRTIRGYNEAWEAEGVDFRLFHGVESDVLEGGRLDHPDHVLEQLDHVIASVHATTTWRGRDETTNTEELLRVLDHPATTVLGHPTGRILQGREGYEVDLPRVLEHMSELNRSGRFVAVELNASPYRLDLDWRLCKRAGELGVPVAINPDAHTVAGLADLRYGVMIARKGWLEPPDVINTLSATELAARLDT